MIRSDRSSFLKLRAVADARKLLLFGDAMIAANQSVYIQTYRGCRRAEPTQSVCRENACLK